MTIQVGVPGNAGGTGGGATNEIAQAGGSVRVESDGSIIIEPVEAASVITVRSPSGDVVDSPRFEFRDSILRGTVGIARVNTDINNAAVVGDMFLNAASRLLLGTAGTNHILMVADVIRFDKASFFQNVGPHSWGVGFIPLNKQYTFQGNISLPDSDPVKFSIEGAMTGETGAQNYAGFRTNPVMNTQTLSEQVDSMIGADFPRVNIIDNLTGGQVIVNAATMRIRGAPTEAQNNWALLIEEGLTALDRLHVFGVGPHVFGQASIPLTSQYLFSGAFVTSGSDSAKFQLANSLTGGSGTQRMRGMALGVQLITQAADQTILTMNTLEVGAPSIVNNLTGSGVITQASTVRIRSAPTAGQSNFALIVEGGLTKFQDTEIAGDVGFYGTGAVAQQTGVAVTDAAIHAALVTLGLITA